MLQKVIGSKSKQPTMGDRPSSCTHIIYASNSDSMEIQCLNLNGILKKPKVILKNMTRSVSEFMSQKLDLITLHGMVKEGGGNGGSP